MFASTVYLKGLGLGASLIMAIGAQNAHVLRMGLKRQHVALSVAACVVVDALLIGLGVAGMGALVQASPLLLGLARWGGVAFLVGYGLRSWRAVWRSESLSVAGEHAPISAGKALGTVLALSLLNPHVYLDTVVLLGAVGANQTPADQPSFAAGAMTASVLWFCLLGFGARLLAPLFNRPRAWQCIDALTGTTMLVLAWLVAWGM
ncbi:amino acid transporter [Chitinimonas arctica]|uniref:Amino acid transporter n=1 Tax=Chitinimonas arctica TaxID=2594795 RepID=A0A516SCD9_9NEIS|nr:LysE/ArgO family amino acid transporter [Chitinimonas arctica]QDQ25810.1 amino acid transporter [Chitinimonas arctica]